jgi:DNA (cytosine-5)-methyltransferase 1
VDSGATFSRDKSLDEKIKRTLKKELKSVEKLAKNDPGMGQEVTDYVPPGEGNPLDEWLHRDGQSVLTNHVSRTHMAGDLHRYLYCSAFAKSELKSPSLKDFPEWLLPNHKNVERARSGGLFADRFRVQVADRPATTITSHIGKDGHYFIHYDPSQCRSLTVREAARIQSFPDDYHFEGPRTQQYTQVGNAVPPFLAHQIADAVWKLLGGN